MSEELPREEGLPEASEASDWWISNLFSARTDEATPREATVRVCATCRRSLDELNFSRTQWNKKQVGVSRCGLGSRLRRPSGDLEPVFSTARRPAEPARAREEAPRRNEDYDAEAAERHNEVYRTVLCCLVLCIFCCWSWLLLRSTFPSGRGSGVDSLNPTTSSGINPLVISGRLSVEKRKGHRRSMRAISERSAIAASTVTPVGNEGVRGPCGDPVTPIMKTVRRGLGRTSWQGEGRWLIPCGGMSAEPPMAALLFSVFFFFLALRPFLLFGAYRTTAVCGPEIAAASSRPTGPDAQPLFKGRRRGWDDRLGRRLRRVLDLYGRLVLAHLLLDGRDRRRRRCPFEERRVDVHLPDDRGVCVA